VQAGFRFIEFAADELEGTVPQRLEQQVSRYPCNIALKTTTREITYSEFNRYANRIARTISHHASTDKPAALLLDHDFEAIFSIFAALKAGRSFVPLDPTLPPTRLRYMLQDSGADLIVTDQQRVELANELADSSKIIDIDRIDPSVDATNLDLRIPPDDMSCILYTSGITGRPKGVIHTHRNELHNVMHHTNSLRINSDDRLTLLGSYSTGQGLQDLYCALLNGATLYPWNLKVEGLSQLANWLIKERMTIYHSAATVFRGLIRTLTGNEKFPDLRILRLGSEHVSWKDVEAYKRHFSKDCVFVNALSSSETKTICQYVASTDTQITGLVPVGYAVADTTILILDPAGNSLGPGHSGEIAVRSRFISPGYWQNPDATDRAYGSDQANPENRLFRTGEWGRMSPDGCLEHLGRRDAQVKIRGYRVETYETELALLDHPEIDQVLVLCRENKTGDKYLAAYIISDASHRPTASELRKFLTERIPQYMIPSMFVFLESFPLTQNGKVDHNALPLANTARPALDNFFVAPTSLIEQNVAGIWTELLGIGEIGIQDNHFDLGGNSLTAMQIVARVEREFKVAVSLKEFFESSTVQDLSRLIVAGFGSTTTPPNSLPIELAPKDDALPLSFAQQRLWFLDQWEPGSPVYNICRAYRLRGNLDIGAMQESLSTIVQRHEVLRTCFPAIDGQPSQVITSCLEIPLRVIDLREIAAAERYEKSLQITTEDAKRPFDLRMGPTLRTTLVRIGVDEHLFALTVHQIVCDGWSMQILEQEFWSIYEALVRHVAPALAVLPVQYADFALWQRQWVQTSALQSQTSYWKNQLDRSRVLNLPVDHPRPAHRRFHGFRQPVALHESLTEAIKELTRRHGATLFMVLLTAFEALLHRYGQDTDFAIGFPIANRSCRETSCVVGSFVNTLVLRANVSGNPSFTELLCRVRDDCVGAYVNQDLPFDKLIEELQPMRDPTRNPVFQVMFVHQIPDNSVTGVQSIVSEPVDMDLGTSKFDLTFSLAERRRRIVGFIEYSTDLFDRDRIERMAGHFHTLLEGIVADPDQSIATLPILTEAERHQIVFEWNDTTADYPKDKCIHHLFEDEVERTPEAIAVEFEDQQITYRELNQRANQLAHYLMALGIGPERLVGICVERSIEMVISLLGILKAGGAYVPLDTAYPKERLRFMLEDSQVSVLLTEQKLIEDRAWKIDHGDTQSSVFDPRVEIVCLDRDRPEINQQSRDNPSPNVQSQNLAYVIYTSGSTGQPKGVQIEHRSVLNCLVAIGKQIELKPQDKWLAVTTISFDIATLELFLPLITGAKLVFANSEESGDATQLVARLRTSKANVMQATPSMWQLLFETGWQCPAGFKILSGGEAITRGLAHRFLTGTDSVWNLYGPTESTIWSTTARVSANESSVPIGRPIANTQIYILDPNLQLVPIGVPGELYIGGDGLARDYLKRPELTAEKFVRNPFNENTHSRLYRTGDLAKYRADGNIEFLGRADNQVKIRGHRIELGEIESVLNQHPSVKEAVVVPRARDSEEKDLAAYIVGSDELSPTVAELRGFLQERLPEFMIPSGFTFLEVLPLTPNGKIDRDALPTIDGVPTTVDDEFVEPRTEIEELVAQIWREVLKRDRIGVHDNFFDLGGHSLLATRVVARLQSNFHIDLPLRKLFEHPTVAGLAEYIDRLRRSSAGTTIMPIVPVGQNQALPLSFSQRRLWYLQKVDPNLSAYNIPAAFRIRGDLDSPALEQALNEVIARHEILRSCVKEIDGRPLQESASDLRIPLPVIDLTDLSTQQAEAEVNRLFHTNARQLYDLSNAPLLRTRVVKLADDDQVLILNFHHMIADGSSLAIFYRELGVFYDAARHKKKASLPPLPIQYVDFAAWQQEWLKSDAFEIQMAYWKHRLADLPTPVELAKDFDRLALLSYRGARLTRRLSEESTAALKSFSRQHGATLFMTLFATFNILLSRITGQEDIIVGSTIAGRNRAETEGLIGFFINALPLRTDLSGDPSFSTLLQRVREICLDAYSHQEMPFEKLVEELRPPRDSGHNPIFDVLFNVADTSERTLVLTGCDIVKLPSPEPEAKFDIVLHAPEIDGRIELAAVYNTSLFREARIALLLDQWATLLEQAARNPELPISQLSLVTDGSHALLPDPTEILDKKWEGAIHEILGEQARRSPGSIAVVDPEQTWSYRELDEGSNQLANTLIAAGVEPKDTVAIYAERNASIVIAIFGVLKAGASFLILDPAYPSARTLDYLRIAQPKGWLEIAGIGEPPEDLLNHLRNLDLRCRITIPSGKSELLQGFSALPINNVEITIAADDPAYIAFTSGSTGEPKGVICRHGPITHFLPWQQEAFGLTENDRFAMLSGLAYSHLHRDVFTAIYLGATIYIPSSSEARSPDQLARWLKDNSITVLHLTPALGELLLTGVEAHLPSVRRVFFGGDILPISEVARIRELAPNAIVGSFYGATETQRAVGYYEITDSDVLGDQVSKRTVPLGHGIKDVQLLVLNKSGQLAGIGEFGEVFVRSPHLAAGYILEDERTRRMFITNPFTHDQSDRLYRTGELGRYLPDGNVEWDGRTDRRVNIRGFRVELEEIESVLKSHPTVKNAAVVLQEFQAKAYATPKSGGADFDNRKSQIENPKSDRRLVAYIAADEEPQSLEDLLHSYLSARLPDYMLPAHFVILNSLPLSPNGKIDYRALPPVRFSADDTATAPRNDIEVKLQAIFAEVLGGADIGIDDNFFRIGGHSLLAARAAARIGDAFGVRLELASFLETPTVMGLAMEVASLLAPGQSATESDKDEREDFEV
jgi:amino acid adenylation domain-containing protein